MEKYTNDKISLTNVIKTEDVINCKVLRYDDEYNLVVELGKNKKGIIKRDEISFITDKENIVPKRIVLGYLNRNIKVRVKEINKEEEYPYVLSRKEIEIEAKKCIEKNLKDKVVMDGKIINIQKYGAFVEVLNGTVGLLHIEDISVARIRHPLERLNIGEQIKVTIKSYDANTGRMVLSHKELLGTWQENASIFKEGMEVKGIAREKEKNGIFIELTPNLVGLAEHKSGIEYGQIVKVYIKKIVPEKKKIKLVIV